VAGLVKAMLSGDGRVADVAEEEYGCFGMDCGNGRLLNWFGAMRDGCSLLMFPFSWPLLIGGSIPSICDI
jgi:hypothetical protein